MKKKEEKVIHVEAIIFIAKLILVKIK